MFSAASLRPMLAVLTDSDPPLTDPHLVYEPKYDGIRAIVEVVPGTPGARVRFWSRNGNEKTHQFPEIAGALAEWARALSAPVVIDGEIVALHADGRPAGFQRLQNRINVTVPGYRSRKPILPPDQQPAALVTFDLLRDGDTDWRGRPLVERRAALEALFARAPAPSSTLRLIDQARGDGRALHQRALDEGWEGLLVKLARAPYRDGRRSAEWRKLKLVKQDEFVVGGYTEPKGTRVRFGSLILGILPSNRRSRAGLTYVGDVGTGFSHDELERVWRLLEPLRTDACPFDGRPKPLGVPRWVAPVLVAQVRYAEMTDEGRLRHPVYLGLRDDKAATEVRKGSATKKTRPVKRTAPRNKVDLSQYDGLIEQLNDLEQRRKDGRIALPDGDTLEVTNLGKVFWPEGRKTKGDLIRYYARVAPLILPVVDNRPLVMKRMPNGVASPFFYQHRAPEQPPKGVRLETLPDDDVPARLIGGSLKTLLYMAQLASISMDPWFSTMDDLHAASEVAIDLDPQPGATFPQILDVARWVRDELVKLEVPGFPKTSGSEGLHVYIPLPPGTPYHAGMLFCQIVATMVASKHPKVATVERTVNRRKPGTVYVDYLQNIEGKTLACAYSARASAFAGVSAPLTWKEIDDSPAPQDFTIDSMADRVTSVGDLWKGLRDHEGADLLGALEKLR
jgi:bifunctional non-homologous end joining protein LigD